MTPYEVVVTARAEEQVRTIRAWWAAERAGAPGVFTEELAASFERIATLPRSGSPYPVPTPAGVRRVLLRRSRYHVYYTIDDPARRVVVRAVWHTSRGSGPELR